MNGRWLPRLDPRLTALAEHVRPGSRTADIGTDHGHLITWLAATGKIPGGYACDINKKPLEKAAFSLSACGVAHQVKLVLGPGLTELQEGDCDDIVIAGMGGDMIWKIIEEVPWTRQGCLRFVLQPMTKAEQLRRRLYENGFLLDRETAVISSGFPYVVMTARYVGGRQMVSEAFAYGGLLLEAGDEASSVYLEKVIRVLAERVQGLRRSSNLDPERLQRLEADIKALEALSGGIRKGTPGKKGRDSIDCSTGI